MALRIVEQAQLSDTGRQREANEDSWFARAGVFAVADGMGGAQAGEVASRTAVEAFGPADRGEASPEAFLRSVALTANDRIHSLSREDTARSGMGTTFTAALIEGDEVSLAHVGDSRAYVLREGDLRLLTSDHSLVEELRRQGRLTDEQAEDHPQRSIITRALGPEPEVEVDTMTYRARPGDVYLLCSDGLTTMVKEARIRELLVEAPDLKAAVRRLVDDANAAGGRDNVTVVAFRLEEAEVAAAAAGEPTPAEGATLVGPAAEEAGLTSGAVREARAGERPGAEPRQRRRAAPPPKERRRGRTALKVLASLVVLAVVVAGAILGARQIYFLGTDEGGRIALYRGLPYDLPFGVELYSEVYSSPVQVASLPTDRRESVTEHELRSRDDAESLIEDLETEVEPPPARAGGDGGNGAGGGDGRQGADGDGASAGGGGSASN